MYQKRWKYNNFNILLVVKINIAHTLNAHWLPHNHHKKFTMDKGKTFLNLLVIQCCQTNTHLLIFWTGKGWEGRKKLLHWTAKNKKSMETDSLKCHLCPGSISVRELHFTPLSPSSETQGQIVGARESLNGRKNMTRRKVKNGDKSPWGQCLTRPVPNGSCCSAFWLGRKTQPFSGTNQKSEWRRPFGTGRVRHCPQGLFLPFFTFLCATFSTRLDFPSPLLSAPGSPRKLFRKLSQSKNIPRSLKKDQGPELVEYSYHVGCNRF